jgi:hypothetical protein
LDQEDLAKLLDILGASKRNARAVAVELTPGGKKNMEKSLKNLVCEWRLPEVMMIYDDV